MRFHRFALIPLMTFFLGLNAMAVDERAGSPSTPAIPTSSDEGLYLVPGILMDVSAFGGTTLLGGIGFSGDVTAQYYFLPYVGVYGGMGITGRRFEFASSGHVAYFEMPVGLAFRYQTNPAIRNTVGIGLWLGQPFANYEDTSGPISLQTVLGLHLPLESYFPITENLELGLKGSLRFAFASAFRDIPNASMIGVQLGLGARIRL